MVGIQPGTDGVEYSSASQSQRVVGIHTRMDDVEDSRVACDAIERQPCNTAETAGRAVAASVLGLIMF